MVRPLLVAVFVLTSPSVRAAEGPGACDNFSSVDEALEASSRQLDIGAADQAVVLLKACRQRFPAEPAVALGLAQAYRLAGNAPWARRTLAPWLADPRIGCMARAHLAWTLLEGADYRGARDVLAEPGCPVAPAQVTRWRLLQAFADHQGKQIPAAREHLAEGQGAAVTFPEDRALLAFLGPRLFPLRRPSLQVEAEVRGGWSSNPLLGSPLDPSASSGDYQSVKVEGDVWGRLASPWLGPASFFVEIDAKGQQLVSSPARDLSYVGGGLRPGLVLDWGDVALTLAYHGDALAVAADPAYAGQGPWLYVGHRAEASLELANGLSAFAGGGRRSFRDLGRSRFEADGGVGGGGALGRRVFLLGGLTGRVHRATNHAWNLWGLTGLGSVRVGLGAGWSARGMLTVAYEGYPDSAAAAAFHAVDARTDWMLRGRLEAWTPRLSGGLQVGVRYQPTRRFSTAPLYDFADHTILAVVSWRFSGEPWGPRVEAPVGHVPLRTGLEGGREGLGERLQDLLRQDEEAQRGSSCLN